MDLKGKTTIFTYGTLMKGFPNEIVIASFPHENYPATVDNMELYDVGHFPAMVKGKHSYLGELVVFDESLDPNAIYANMDRLEGYDKYNPDRSLYVREKVTVKVLGDSIDTEVYLWNQSTSRLKHLSSEHYSGYREYIEER